MCVEMGINTTGGRKKNYQPIYPIFSVAYYANTTIFYLFYHYYYFFLGGGGLTLHSIFQSIHWAYHCAYLYSKWNDS